MTTFKEDFPNMGVVVKDGLYYPEKYSQECIQLHCLDKQKVSDAIRNVRNRCERKQFTHEADLAFDWLQDELGL